MHLLRLQRPFNFEEYYFFFEIVALENILHTIKVDATYGTRLGTVSARPLQKLTSPYLRIYVSTFVQNIAAPALQGARRVKSQA